MAARSETIANVVTAVAGLAIVVVVGTTVWRNAPERSAAGAPELWKPVEPVSELSLADTVIRGAANAQLVFVELADFQCPACGQYARETFPRIVREFVDTGVVKYVFLNHPNVAARPQAFRASEAAECAGMQGAYWPMHDLLFNNQSYADDATLIAYASSVGTDDKAFRACLQSGARARVEAHLARGKSFSVSSTPTFLLGRMDGDTVRIFGKIVGAHPYDAFRVVLQAQIKILARAVS